MNDQYKEIRKQADDLKFTLRDKLDNREHPLAQSLERETEQLVQDVESEKKPRNIEDRVKQIQRLLMQARDQGEAILDPGDGQALYHEYERLRDDIRQLPED